jgi:hypothetical protein
MSPKESFLATTLLASVERCSLKATLDSCGFRDRVLTE